MSQVAEPPRGVHLATEPDFRLGSLEVSPSGCRLRIDGREQRVPPRVMEVLVVLVRAGGRTVSRDDLVETCWGGRFVSDDAISRVIAEVRNLARGVDPPPFMLETVPKVGYRLVRRDVEAAQTGGEPPGASTTPAPRRLSRRALVAVAGLTVLLLVAGGLALWRFQPAPQRPAWQNGRVQVVRFEPLAQDPALQRLSLTLGDSIVRMLTTAGVETPPQTAPRDTGAGDAEFRIAGTVDRDGGDIVVNAQVLDRRSGLVLWSERITRDADSLAGFQEEAGREIAGVLDCGLVRRTRARRPMSSAVFGHFLKACGASRSVGAAGWVEVTRRLVDAAPEHSQAHSFHALSLAFLASESDSTEDAATLRTAARGAASRALELDPRNAEAHVALAQSYRAGSDWRVRERHLLKAGELDPGFPLARGRYVDLLREVGRIREAIEANEGTLAAHPLNAYQPARLAMMWAAQGDLPRAEALAQQASLLSPGEGRSTRLTIAFWWEPPAAGRRKVRELGGRTEPARALECLDAYLARLERAAGAPIRGLPETCDTSEPDWRTRMLARQGDIDGAYAELARPLPLSRGHTIFLFYPEMKAFRADPRFMPLAKRLGLVDYWLESGRWPDFCAERDLPYDCRAVARSLSPAAAR